MSREQWLRYAVLHKATLREFITAYHPAISKPVALAITAPDAEKIRQGFVREIAEGFVGDPVAQFDAALDAGDNETAGAILEDAWFGVPESTEAWQIPGFKEAVRLMGD